MDPSVAKAHDLRSGQTVGVDHAAGAFQTHDNFITLTYTKQNSRHLFAQQCYFAGPDIAMKIQHKDSLFRLLRGIFLRLGLRFSFFLLCFLPFFHKRQRERRHLEGIRHIPKTIVNPFNLNLLGRRMTIAHGNTDDAQEDADNQQKECQCFCEE